MSVSQLPFFGVVRVSGDDRTSFLHSQLSNHIEAIAPQYAAYATYNTPKGRVLANMILVNRGEDILLIMAQDLIEATIKRLKMFVLRAKVQFEPLNNYAVAGELPTNSTPTAAQEPQYQFPAPIHNNIIQITLPHGGILWVGEAQYLPPYQIAAAHAWQQHEIASGYPWISQATTETAVAQMLNQHLIGGVHFKKGCYPGQEIIARAQYRGQVKRSLAVFSTHAIAHVGETLQLNGEEAGIIINSVPTNDGSLNLAVIKHHAAHQLLNDQYGNIFQPAGLQPCV